MKKKLQRLYDGDEHGAISAALVEEDSGGRYARVHFWLRSSGHKVDFQCEATEADAIAKRLVTPIQERQ